MKKIISTFLVLLFSVSTLNACDKTNLTISFVLDRSGSMGDIKDQAIDSFNEYLSTLQQRKHYSVPVV